MQQCVTNRNVHFTAKFVQFFPKIAAFRPFLGLQNAQKLCVLCAPPKLSVPYLKWGIGIDLILVCPTINRLYPIYAPPVAAC